MLPSRRKRSSPLMPLLAALVAVLVLLAVLLRQPLSGALWRVLAPVVALRDAAGQGDVAQLRAQLASTTAALADRDRLAAENAELKLELGRGAKDERRALAGVLLHPPGTPYDTLVIDAGQAQGIAVGDLVFAGALAIGTVDELYLTTARVILYSAPGLSYDATLTTEGGALPVSVEGQGAGSMSARVPSGTPVKAGDRVDFPGLAGGVTGTVTAVFGADTDTFKTVYLRLPIDLFALQYVYVQL